MTAPTAPVASEVDVETYGPYLPRDRTGAVLGRTDPAFTGRVTADGSSGWPAEPGRYHLYAAAPCPFSHRSVIVLHLLGLTDVVTVSYVDPMRDGRGWAFRSGRGHAPDGVNGFAFLREAYLATDPDYDGPVSVPVLWDRRTGRIVSNDHRVLSTDLAAQFGARAAGPDLYPEPLREQIDALDAWLFTRVHDGPYRCGFAPDQATYDREVRDLFAALDELEVRLASSRYLFGEEVTEADVRLWVTLARFDSVYVTHFRANLRRLVEYPRLWAYARDLYRLPAFRDTTDFAHIKEHYFRTHPWINPSGVVPAGPLLDWTPDGTEGA